ncbi:MAG TPA: hypothetical protein VGD67_26455 [Pseudonocardiaceae bacterium]
MSTVDRGSPASSRSRRSPSSTLITAAARPRIYRYGTGGTVPTGDAGGTAYWVDVVFTQ